MKQDTYTLLAAYMRSCTADTVHDQEHIFRVLYTALDIAQTEPDVDMDVLIAACLLHGVGRRAQARNPALCHAQAGAEQAYRFLLENQFSEDFSAHVRDCVRTHRFRSGDPPGSIEAKILFDADKLDVTGAVGIARTLAYGAHYDEPLYTFLPDGGVCDGSGDAPDSFLHEYKFKLESIYSRFYTARGAELACGRKTAAAAFYDSILQEIRQSYSGSKYLDQYLA